MNTDQTTQEIVPTFSKAAIRHYNSLKKKIHANIQTIDTALFELGEYLREIRDKRLYWVDNYSTFQEFCEKELCNSRQQVYRLIQAHDVMQDLLVQGVPHGELPETERMCREIRLLKPEQRAPIWKALVRSRREEGGRPQIIDVRAEARANETTSETRQRQQGEVLNQFEKIGTALKVSIAFDVLDAPFRRRLGVVLTEIAENVALLIRMLNNAAVQKRAGKDE